MSVCLSTCSEAVIVTVFEEKAICADLIHCMLVQRETSHATNCEEDARHVQLLMVLRELLQCQS